jgi:outer membrane protein TolC
MAYMAGNFDETIQQISQQPLPKIPLPQDLPLHLISKRPDITAQLWLIESAGRQIEVAKAGFYPDFNLTAFFGFQTIHFAELFKWPSTFFNVNPAVSLPIFDGGRLIANLHSSEINYAIAILDYNNLIINTTKEVLDAISIVRNTHQRLSEYERKFAYQSEMYRLTNLRISHSLDNSLNGLVSEENMLVSQDQEVIALERTIQAILRLIKSIGGGYESCEV